MRGSSARSWQGVIAVDVPAAARRTATGLEVIDFAAGLTFRAEGVLADEIEGVLSGAAAPSARLRALVEAEPALAAVLAGSQRVPLERAAALRLDGFDTLFVELTGRCNEQCVHCYAESGPEVKDALDVALAESAIDDAAELGFSRVQLTGGEPLLSPGLVPLVRRIRERRMQPEIYTNALLLRGELLDSLALLAPSVAVSFYSHDPALHDAITRTPGSQRRTLAGIEAALARGLAVRAAIIVMQQNAAGIAETAELLRRVGVQDVGISGAHAVGRGEFFAGELPALPRAGHRASGPAPRRGTLCVTSRGEVVPCIFNRSDVLGRLPAQRLRDIVQRPSAPQSAAGLPAWGTRLQCAGCRTSAWALRAAEA